MAHSRPKVSVEGNFFAAAAYAPPSNVAWMGHNHWRVLVASILSTGAPCDHRPGVSLLAANIL